MKLNKETRKALREEIAKTQDGGLRGGVMDPLNNVILRAINKGSDTEEVERDINYAINELTKALTVIKSV